MLKKEILDINKFLKLITANLHDNESTVLFNTIDELSKLSTIKLLSIDSDVVIDKHYNKSETNGTYALHTALSKVYSTISGSTELLNTYTKLSADMYMFFKQLKLLLDRVVYETYVKNDRLNIHSNFDKTFLRTMAYNYNLIKKDK